MPLTKSWYAGELMDKNQKIWQLNTDGYEVYIRSDVKSAIRLLRQKALKGRTKTIRKSDLNRIIKACFQIDLRTK